MSDKNAFLLAHSHTDVQGIYTLHIVHNTKVFHCFRDVSVCTVAMYCLNFTGAEMSKYVLLYYYQDFPLLLICTYYVATLSCQGVSISAEIYKYIYVANVYNTKVCASEM